MVGVGEGMVAVVSSLPDSGLTVSLLDANNQYTLLPSNAVNHGYPVNNQTVTPTQYRPYPENTYVTANNHQNISHSQYNNMHNIPAHNINSHNLQHNIATQHLPGQNIHSQNFTTHTLNPRRNINSQNLPAHNQHSLNLPAHNQHSLNLPAHNPHNMPTHNLPAQNLPGQNQYMQPINIPAVMAQMIPELQKNMMSQFQPRQTHQPRQTVPHGRRMMTDVCCGETSGVGVKRAYGIQAVDGRYASTYKTSHCFVSPTSPTEIKSEFPPQRPNIHYGDDHFYVDGWGPRRNHQFYGRGEARPDKELPMKSTRAQALFADSLRKYPQSSSPERSAEIIERLLNLTQSKQVNSRPGSPHTRNSCIIESDPITLTNHKQASRPSSPIRLQTERAKWDIYKEEPSRDVVKGYERPNFGTTNEVRFLKNITRKIKQNMKHMSHGNQTQTTDPSTSHDKYEVPQHDTVIPPGTKKNTEAQATAPKCSQQTETMPREPVEKKSVAISSMPEPETPTVRRRLSHSETYIPYHKSYTIQNVSLVNSSNNTSLETKSSRSCPHIRHKKNKRKESNGKDDIEQKRIESHSTYVLVGSTHTIKRKHILDEEDKINNEKCKISRKHKNTDEQLKEVIKEWLKNLSLKRCSKLNKEVNLQDIIDCFTEALTPIVHKGSRSHIKNDLKVKILEILDDLPLDTFQKVTKQVYMRNMAVILIKDILKSLENEEFTDHGSSSSDGDVYFIAESKRETPISSHVREILPDAHEVFNNDMKATESVPSLSSVATEMVDVINDNVNDMNLDYNIIASDKASLELVQVSFDKDDPRGGVPDDEDVKDDLQNFNAVDSKCQDPMDNQQIYVVNLMDEIYKWLQEINYYYKNNNLDENKLLLHKIASDILILKKYIECNPLVFLTEREEDNYLKIVVFKWMSKIFGYNCSKYLQDTRTLNERIQNLDVPLLIKEDEFKYFLRDQLVATASNNNNSYTLGSLNDSTMADDRPQTYVQNLEDAILNWYHSLPQYGTESQNFQDQNQKHIRKLASEIYLKSKENPAKTHEVIDKTVPNECKKIIKGKLNKQFEDDLKTKLKSIPFRNDDYKTPRAQARLKNLKAIIGTWAKDLPVDKKKDSLFSNNRKTEVDDLAHKLYDVYGKIDNKKAKDKKLGTEINNWLGGVPVVSYVNKKNFKDQFTGVLTKQLSVSRIEGFFEEDPILGPAIRQWLHRLPTNDEEINKVFIETSDDFIANLSNMFQSKPSRRKFKEEIINYLNSKGEALDIRFTDLETLANIEAEKLISSIRMMSDEYPFTYSPGSASASFNPSYIVSNVGSSSSPMPNSPSQNKINTEQGTDPPETPKTYDNKSITTDNPAQDRNHVSMQVKPDTQSTALGRQPNMQNSVSAQTLKPSTRSTSPGDDRPAEIRQVTTQNIQTNSIESEKPPVDTQNIQTNSIDGLDAKKPAKAGMSTSIGVGETEPMHDLAKRTRISEPNRALSVSVPRSETPTPEPYRKSLPVNLEPGAPGPQRRYSEPSRKPPVMLSCPTGDPMEKIFEDLLSFLKIWCAKVPITFANPADQELEPQVRLGLQNGILKEILKVRSTDRRCLENKFLFEDMLENEIDNLLDCLEQNPELEHNRAALKNELIQYVSAMNQTIMDMDAQHKQKENYQLDYVEMYDEFKQDNFIHNFVEEHYPDETKLNKIVYTDYLERIAKAFFAVHKIDNIQDKTKEQVMSDLVETLMNVPPPDEEFFERKRQNMLIRYEVEMWFINLPVNELPEDESEPGYVDQRLDNLANMILQMEYGDRNANESRALEYELHVWLLTWSWPEWSGYYVNQWVSELLTRIRVNPDLRMAEYVPDWDFDPEQSLKEDVFRNRQPLSSTMDPHSERRRRSESRAPIHEFGNRSPRRYSVPKPISDHGIPPRSRKHSETSFDSRDARKPGAEISFDPSRGTGKSSPAILYDSAQGVRKPGPETSYVTARGASKPGPETSYDSARGAKKPADTSFDPDFGARKHGAPSRFKTSKGVLGTSQVAGPSNIQPVPPTVAAGPIEEEKAVSNEVNNWIARLPLEKMVPENESNQLTKSIVSALHVDDDADKRHGINEKLSSWLDVQLPESHKNDIPDYADQLTNAVISMQHPIYKSDQERPVYHQKQQDEYYPEQNKEDRYRPDQSKRDRFSPDQSKQERYGQSNQSRRDRYGPDQSNQYRFGPDQSKQDRYDQNQRQKWNRIRGSSFDDNVFNGPKNGHYHPGRNQPYRYNAEKNKRQKWNRMRGTSFDESVFHDSKNDRSTYPMYEMSDGSSEDFTCKCSEEPQSGLKVCMRGPMWYPGPYMGNNVFYCDQ